MSKLCPHCNEETAIKSGFTKSGYQRYRCNNCHRWHSDSPNRQMNKPIGDRPMTYEERLANMSEAAKERRRQYQKDYREGKKQQKN